MPFLVLLLVCVVTEFKRVFINCFSIPTCNAHQSLFELVCSAAFEKENWGFWEEPNRGAREDLEGQSDENKIEPVEADVHKPSGCKQVDAAFKAVPDSSNQVLLLLWHQFNHVHEGDVRSARVEDSPCEEYSA